VTRDWHYFPRMVPAFPPELTAELISRAGIPGTLANCHASGTEVIDQFGPEHIASGKPIVYTSADSVVQIAAHETHFGLERLLDVCRIAAEIFHPLNVGRIIARPFVGETPGSFVRTPNRKDFAIAPPDGTICDRVIAAGGAVHAVGKIGDIFAYKGITDVAKGADDMALFDHVLEWSDK
ncbi:phosphopentomutase, partial [Rhizobiaceae sp. 2RAB30]